MKQWFTGIIFVGQKEASNGKYHVEACLDILLQSGLQKSC